jgi:chromosome partitioning protein
MAIWIMVKIITIAQQKGGATKTTVAMNLAGALMKTKKVLILDMNHEQLSALKWAARGDFFKDNTGALSEKGCRQELERLTVGCYADYIIIDTPPELMMCAIKAALLSDLVIIPCQPSPLDLESAEETIEIVQSAHKPFKLLASNVRRGTLIGNQLPGTLRKIGKTFETTVYQSVSVVESAMLGTWIGAYLHKQTEFDDLAIEVIKELK